MPKKEIIRFRVVFDCGNTFSGQHLRKKNVKTSKVKDKRQVRSYKKYLMKNRSNVLVTEAASYGNIKTI